MLDYQFLMIKKKSHILTVYALFISILIVYVIMAMKFPFAYIWATYEDLVGEWAQFYFFLLALIISVRLAFSFLPRPIDFSSHFLA